MGSEILLPNEYVRGVRMGTAVSKTTKPSERGRDREGNLHEEGGYYGTNKNGQEILIDANPGARVPGGLEIDTDTPGDQYRSQRNWRSEDHIEGSFHTHAGGNGEQTFAQAPSTNDKELSKKHPGNDYVLALGNETVYILKGGQTIGTFPLIPFLTTRAK